MDKPRIIEFKHIIHKQGHITVAEFQRHIPFPLNRVYWLTEVPEGQQRGNHATHEGIRIIVCLKGYVEVTLENLQGNDFKYRIDQPNIGLLIPPRFWSRITFSKDCILLCFVSNRFDESDYIRDYQAFLSLK